jgi:hypothetical protein
MKSYKITSEAGLEMGSYQADSVQEALDHFAQDAGYKSMSDAEIQGFRRSVTATIEE